MVICNGPLLGERDGLRVIGCASCGFAHLETMPNSGDLHRFYASEFWQHEKPGALEHIEEQRDWWSAVHGDWISLLTRHAPGRTLLDVGCGFGHFLDAARARGWSVAGIEPSPAAWAVVHGKGHLVMMEEWESITAGQYDALSVLWLIEHLPDPLRFLCWCNDRLHEGGVLLIVAPNDFSAAQLAVNSHVRRPFWWIDKSHLCYFTWTALENLLGRAGFRVVERTTLYQMEWLLSSAERDYTDSPAIGAALHREVERMDLSESREMRMARYAELAAQGVGREIVIVAVKNG